MSRRRVPFLTGLVLVVVLVIGLPVAALAAYVATGSNSALRRRPTSRHPASPPRTDSLTTVSISWTGTALSTGTRHRQLPGQAHARRHDHHRLHHHTRSPAPTPADRDRVLRVVAKVGSWTSTSPSTSFISDYAAPVSTLSVTPAVNAAGWVQCTNPSFTLAAVDTLSGVQSVSYAVKAAPPSPRRRQRHLQPEPAGQRLDPVLVDRQGRQRRDQAYHRLQGRRHRPGLLTRPLQRQRHVGDATTSPTSPPRPSRAPPRPAQRSSSPTAPPPRPPRPTRPARGR